MDYTRQRAFESRDYLPHQIVQRLKESRRSRAIYTEMPGGVLEQSLLMTCQQKTAEREKPAKRGILLLDSTKEPVTSRPYRCRTKGAATE